MNRKITNPAAARRADRERNNTSGKRCNMELFVAGPSSKSQKAITDVLMLCEKYMKNRYNLKIFDVYKEPGKAAAESVKATPTLLVRYPLPKKRIVGDMRKIERELQSIIKKAPKV